VRFALRTLINPRVIFQPVMFTGGDERISTGTGSRRYPLSQLAYDLQAQTSIDWQPMRDWFPASRTRSLQPFKMMS